MGGAQSTHRGPAKCILAPHKPDLDALLPKGLMDRTKDSLVVKSFPQETVESPLVGRVCDLL